MATDSHPLTEKLLSDINEVHVENQANRAIGIASIFTNLSPEQKNAMQETGQKTADLFNEGTAHSSLAKGMLHKTEDTVNKLNAPEVKQTIDTMQKFIDTCQTLSPANIPAQSSSIGHQV